MSLEQTRQRRQAVGTIHDIVSTDQGDCIVMELVRGQTLGDMIGAGRIPTLDCLKLAMQMADALSAASPDYLCETPDEVAALLRKA